MASFSVINGFPNPFAPLPPPAIFSRAYCDNDVAFYASEINVPVISLIPSTPPLVIREDLYYEVKEITQQEFLASIPGWNPVAAKDRFYS